MVGDCPRSTRWLSMEGYGSVSGWSIEDWRKTWEGIVVVNRRGRAKVNGGHGFGKGWPGKTEFPERWTFADMQYATMLTWHDPHVVRESGDCQYARRVVDRVLDGGPGIWPWVHDFSGVVPRQRGWCRQERTW